MLAGECVKGKLGGFVFVNVSPIVIAAAGSTLWTIGDGKRLSEMIWVRDVYTIWRF